MSETSRYKCPTWLMHVFKHRILKMHKNGELVDDIYFKSVEGKFSVGGVLCDIWVTVTGKGAWVGADQLRYETYTGTTSFASQSVPYNIINAFAGKSHCPVSNFLKITNFTLDQIIPVLEKMEDYSAVEFKREDKFEYLVIYKEAGASVTAQQFKAVIHADSFNQARLFFMEMFRGCEIVTVNYVKKLD